jgi:hydrogenase maturation protease
MSRAKAVLIGYGNTLREDDGAGPLVADRVAELHLPGVAALSVHQLTPELAAALAEAKVAVFVDASVAPGLMRASLSEIRPNDAAEAADHSAGPADILALCRLAYGRSPTAWLIEIPARRMGFGEQLSPDATAGVDEAIEIARSILSGVRADA